MSEAIVEPSVGQTAIEVSGQFQAEQLARLAPGPYNRSYGSGCVHTWFVDHWSVARRLVAEPVFSVSRIVMNYPSSSGLRYGPLSNAPEAGTIHPRVRSQIESPVSVPWNLELAFKTMFLPLVILLWQCKIPKSVLSGFSRLPLLDLPFSFLLSLSLTLLLLLFVVRSLFSRSRAPCASSVDRLHGRDE